MDENKKRRVGRPPINISDKIVPKEGIVNQPENIELRTEMVNVMEMVYDNTKLIGKLLELVGNIYAGKVSFYFEKTRVIIFFRISNSKNGVTPSYDSLKENDIVYIEMRGSEMNRYYCSNDFSIDIEDAKSFSKVSRTSKHFNSIKFVITRYNMENTNKMMDIKLVLDSMDTEDISSIPFSLNDVPIDQKIKDDVRNINFYPLRFNTLVSFFKTSLIDINITGIDKLRIQRDQDNMLMFEYLKANGEVEKFTNFRDPIKINLIYDGDYDDTITYTVNIKTIFELISKNITENIELFVSNYSSLGIVYRLDSKMETCKFGGKNKKTQTLNSERIKITILVNNS